MLLIAAVLAYVAVAQPARPSISEDFYADVETTLHSQDQDMQGRGRWAVDTSSNEGIEDYQFQDQHQRPFFVLNLQRYDLGNIYTIDSADHNQCQAHPVQGQMPTTWGWIAQATYDGTHDFHGQTLNVWNASFGGVELAVGVTQQDANTPVFFFRGQTTSSLFIYFDRFNASTTFNQTWFDVPPQCQHHATKSLHLGATPARPSISELFESAVAVNFQRSHGQYITGNGRLAANQPAGLFVEDYDLESPQDHNYVKLFNLFRYDLGKAYFIDSHNWRDCHEAPTNGTLQPFWGWIAYATFQGQHQGHEGLEDVWSYLASGVNITISVLDSNINTPLWLSQSAPGTNEFWAFNYFNGTAPNSQDFAIPTECQQ